MAYGQREPYMPTAPCGKNPWYCQYEPTDSNCCQYPRIQAQRKKMDELRLDMNYDKELTNEYGPKIHPIKDLPKW